MHTEHSITTERSRKKTESILSLLTIGEIQQSPAKGQQPWLTVTKKAGAEKRLKDAFQPPENETL